ncbi:SH3 domain-containing protein [Azospirillum sp. TSO22-1]|uniref:SH3 domain-containing protein n=1 Tax=Azospirillum sp. TSO22-1 TaxID=716789 RepID=UPI001304F3D3|nr:SH3 domain-containing protein [Azospirillum sp. TSO22-1]
MARVLVHLVLCVVLLAGGPVLAAEKRVALVIGNARYERGGAVPAVAANAAAVAEALRQTGFDVTVANNREHRGLVAALSHFAARARGAELGVIYYSGLALSAGGRNFLVPVDAKLEAEGDVVLDTLDLDQVLQQMQAPKRGVLLLDPVVPNPVAEVLKTVRPVPGPPGPADTLLIAYAHQPDTPPTPVRGNGPGPFAAALAEELVKLGADLRGALTEVQRGVAARTGGAQKPWMQDRLGPTVALLPEAPPEPKPEPKIEPLDGSFVVTRDVNLRQTPDSKAPVVRRLARDTTVAATGRVRQGSWTRVTVDGQQGFVSNEYLKRPGAAPPPPAPAVADTGVRRVLRDATLFDRPVLGARGVRELPAGMMLTVVEPAADGNWVKVRDRFGQEGYVSAGTLGIGEGEERILSGTSAPTPSPGGSSAPEPARAARETVAGGESVANRARAMAQRGIEAQRRAREAAEAARGITATAWVQRFANGDVYEGEWASTAVGGIRQVQRGGYGVYRFADGQLYEGEWRNDEMAGLGVMAFRTGDRYAGGFRAGQPEGLGVFRYANGDGYAGEVRANSPDGVGELSFANGDRYQGPVSGRRPSGNGASDRLGAWQGAGAGE